jgi:hypothetical protein
MAKRTAVPQGRKGKETERSPGRPPIGQEPRPDTRPQQPDPNERPHPDHDQERLWFEYWRKSNNPDRPNRYWSPWLLVRDRLGDVGLRPLPGGEVFWLSPDIWVESTDPHRNPVAGQPNFVHVVVRNLGMADAFPVKIDFYWADPSVGLGPGDMNLIGSERVLVHRGEIKDVKCWQPWVPTLVNQGHECVMVNCNNHVLDPIINPFQPTLDRHVGQRNLHVVGAPSGGTIDFGLWLNNPFSLRAATTVAVMSERLPRAEASTRIGEHLANREAREAAGAALAFRVRSAIGEGSVLYNRQASADRFLGERLNAIDREGIAGRQPAGRFNVLHTLDMQPLERRRFDVKIDVPPDTRPGETMVFHFEQRFDEFTVGGYSVAIVVDQRNLRYGDEGRLA